MKGIGYFTRSISKPSKSTTQHTKAEKEISEYYLRTKTTPARSQYQSRALSDNTHASVSNTERYIKKIGAWATTKRNTSEWERLKTDLRA